VLEVGVGTCARVKEDGVAIGGMSPIIQHFAKRGANLPNNDSKTRWEAVKMTTTGYAQAQAKQES
jgi:hypothetical protein